MAVSEYILDYFQIPSRKNPIKWLLTVNETKYKVLKTKRINNLVDKSS